MKNFTCGFIGLGLIGGSIAKALKQYAPSTQILAYDTNKETLALSQKEGIVDTVFHSMDSSLGSCDFLFLCAPVAHNVENLRKIQAFLSENCILTDVGSVKSEIHHVIEELGLQSSFIGGHPMAGSERTGYLNAKAMLLENAYYIVTPNESTSTEKLNNYLSLVETLHAIPLKLSYAEHDYVTAAISHLPHILAAALVNLVKDSDNAGGTMKQIAAGGFKDITRIASSSALMWEQICITNREPIMAFLDHYISSLTTIREQLSSTSKDSLYHLFEDARTYRESFPESSAGPIKKDFTIYVDIPDKTGALAEIATILADFGINIKNIGIVHNREVEEGVLRIEFYEETAPKLAASLLLEKGYSMKGSTE